MLAFGFPSRGTTALRRFRLTFALGRKAAADAIGLAEAEAEQAVAAGPGIENGLDPLRLPPLTRHANAPTPDDERETIARRTKWLEAKGRGLRGGKENAGRYDKALSQSAPP